MRSLLSPSVASMPFLHLIYLFKQQYTHIFFCTSQLVQKQKNKEENHVPNKTCPTLRVWWCSLLAMLRCSWPQHSINARAMACESPYRLSWFFSSVSFQEWSCTWSHYPFSSESTGELDDSSSVSWPGMIWSWESQEKFRNRGNHTLWWPRKEENPSPILNSGEFRNVTTFAGMLWKDKNIL